MEDASVEQIGYGALFAALSVAFGEGGAPPRPPQDEVAGWSEAERGRYLREATQYSLALNGAGYDSGPEQRDSGDITTVDGCRAKGQQAVAGLSLLDPLPEWTEDALALTARLRGSDEYLSFEQEWQRCMQTAGYGVASPMRRDGFGVLLLEFSDRLTEISSDAPDEYQALSEAAEVGANGLTIEWYDRVVSMDDEIEAMHMRELAQARTDAECRSLSAEEIRPVLLAIESEPGSPPATAATRLPMPTATPTSDDEADDGAGDGSPCPSPFPVGEDTDGDGVIDTCYEE